MGFQASRERFGFQAGCGNRRPASGLTSKPGRPQAGVRQRRRQSEPTSAGSDVRLRSTSNRGPRQTGSHLQLGPTSPWVLRQTGPQLRAGPTSAPVLPPTGSHLRLIPTSDRVLPPTRSHRQLGPTSHWVSPHAWVPPHTGSCLRRDPPRAGSHLTLGPASDWIQPQTGFHTPLGPTSDSFWRQDEIFWNSPSSPEPAAWDPGKAQKPAEGEIVAKVSALRSLWCLVERDSIKEKNSMIKKKSSQSPKTMILGRIKGEMPQDEKV
ncbi:uncharacterized protein LOC109494092 isoform X2 [Felis catus]|uniref:uncharacterized protein LOC109494092 isoform X2 n=1 Tax=Felis catus TaxID=9685 RepID=UPI001D1A0FF3|nr:uncharacterized protein LOC109494092 isoform X2 [Felis catus]